MKRWVAFVLVALVFVSGVAVGVLGARLRGFRHLYGDPSRESRGAPERLREELDLTPEQAERVADIVRESHAASRELRESLHPRVRAVMEESARRIDEVLTPAQREKFSELRRAQRRRVDSWLLGRGDIRRGWGGRGPRHSPPHSPPPLEDAVPAKSPHPLTPSP